MRGIFHVAPQTSESQRTIKISHPKERQNVRGGGSFLRQRAELAQLRTPANPVHLSIYSSRQLWDAEDLGRIL